MAQRTINLHNKDKLTIKVEGKHYYTVQVQTGILVVIGKDGKKIPNHPTNTGE
jgi:hypothetical protein